MRRTPPKKEISSQLRRFCPLIPMADFMEIETIAQRAQFRQVPASIAVQQAMSAHIRHNYTEYDELLALGYDRDAARYFVLSEMNAVLDRWGATFRFSGQET